MTLTSLLRLCTVSKIITRLPFISHKFDILESRSIMCNSEFEERLSRNLMYELMVQ